MGKYGIVILGNGFDLFHEHKTSYKNFITAIKDEYSTNLWINYFDSVIKSNNWVDIENEFFKILNDMSILKNEYSFYNYKEPIHIKYLQLFKALGFSYNLYTKKGYEKIMVSRNETALKRTNDVFYDKIIISETKFDFIMENGNLKYKTIDKKLIDDFLELKELLKKYIKSEVKITENYSKENAIYKTINTYDDLIVLNFNYTDTLSFYNSNITNIFVHGSVDDEIIFGHNNIEQIDYSMFNKHVQTQISDINYKYKFVNTLLEKNFEPAQLFDLIILGHSFDANDHGVISWMYTTLFNNRNYFSRFKYFYYPTKSNDDLINRNFNIKTFYEKNIGSFTNETLDFLNGIRYQNGSIPMQINIKHGEIRIYNGSDELDYFQRTGTFEKIELT